MAPRKLSRLVPRDQRWLIVCLVLVSVIDSVVSLTPLLLEGLLADELRLHDI